MKILSIVYDLIRGGTEGQCARVAMAHAQADIDHQVAVMRRKGFFLDQVESLCGPIYHFNIQKMLSLDTAQKIKNLAEYIKVEQFDLVHGWDMDAAIFGYPAARRAGVPFLTSRRNMADMLPQHKAWMLERVDLASAGVVVNAEAIKDRIASFGCPSQKIHVIPNILDLGEFDQATQGRERPDSPVVGIVCRLEPEKDVACFVQAAAILAKQFPKVQFEIVGDGSEREQLEALTHRLGLGDQLRFLGGRGDVPRILSEWTVGTLVPSKNEGLSNAILEYFAAGIPCVATDNGGNRELIERSGAGEVIPIADANGLARVWRSWLDDNSVTTKMGAFGRSYVARVHNVTAVSQRFSSLYETVISDA